MSTESAVYIFMTFNEYKCWLFNIACIDLKNGLTRGTLDANK